ncbi:hypothetical protein AAK899_05360 [Erysipelotrichaceae bacterium 51-3]
MSKQTGAIYIALPLISAVMIGICSPSQAAFRQGTNMGLSYLLLAIGLIIYTLCLTASRRLWQSGTVSKGIVIITLVLCLMIWILVTPVFPIPLNGLTNWISTRYNPFSPGLAFSYLVFCLIDLLSESKKPQS